MNCQPWTADETAALDAILRERTLVADDLAHFPGRTAGGMLRKGSKRRAELGIAHHGRGRPRVDGAGPSIDASAQDTALRQSWANQSHGHLGALATYFRVKARRDGISFERAMQRSHYSPTQIAKMSAAVR